MDKKKYLSGGAKKKKREEKQEREAAVIKDVRRITSFYKKIEDEIDPEDTSASTSSGGAVPLQPTANVSPASATEVPEQPEEDTEPVPAPPSTSTAGEPSEDPALWGVLSESHRENIIARGAMAFHNRGIHGDKQSF